jgi:hypothetical protein
MEVSEQLHGLVAFPPGESASATLCVGGLVGPRAALDVIEKRKILPFLGIETPTFQPITRRYTYWATPALYDRICNFN